MDKSDKKSAYDEAAAFLGTRMRTVAEVRKRLLDKEYPESEIEEVINDLIGLRYLDDYEYAKIYYQHNTEKQRGGRRAMRELEEKGVDKQTVKFAFEDYMYEAKVDEYRIALKIARTVAEDAADIDDKLIAKVARKLENKGFAHDDIFRVMSEMRRWDNNTEYN